MAKKGLLFKEDFSGEQSFIGWTHGDDPVGTEAFGRAHGGMLEAPVKRKGSMC